MDIIPVFGTVVGGSNPSGCTNTIKNMRTDNQQAFLLRKDKTHEPVRLVGLGKIRGQNLKEAYIQAENEAREEYNRLKYNPLFISGLSIYWGEGEKASTHKVFIANTDPKMIKLFSRFLKDICGLIEQKAWILSYPDLDEGKCKAYWIQNAGLEQGYFTKTMVIKGKSESKRLSYGVCNIGVSGAYLKRKVMVWIELLSKDVTS